MEEASVAGESPDRSKQQKSSGTARSESDPRLAVFREESAGGEGGGATDTATAVLRTGPSGDGDSGDEGADAQGTGSGRADTATAVFRTPSSARAEGSGGSDGSDDSNGPDGSDAAGRAAEGRKDAESQATSEGSESPEDSAGASDADAEGSKGSGGAADADAMKPEPGDARLREAVAAWVAKDDGPKSDDDAVEPAAAEDAGAERTDGEEADSEAAGASGKGTGSVAAEAGTDAAAEGDVDDAERPDAGPVTEPGAKSESESGPEAGKPDSRPAAGTKADEADSEAADEAEEGDKDSRNSGDSKADADKDTEADADEAPQGDTGTKDAKEAKDANGDERGVDQPTAVFRTPAAGADQPTTALKVTPPPSRTEPGSEPKPESDAERTSKFVPLRQDDIRPAKVPAAASVATPGAHPAAPSFVTAERTTQQPMPPKPPLDLLAELTNTPPPPETPVRVAVRRVKIWTPLVLLLLVVFAIVQMVRPLPDPELQMSAKPTYTFKGSKPSLPWPDEGQGYMAATGLGEVDSFGEQKAVPIGSVAKAMTAYIVLKDHPLKKGEKGPSIKIDAKAEADGKLDAEGESTLNTVKAGDTLTEQEALAAIMIPSANNIARLLARWDAGSEEAFVKKMNDTAKSLGMKNTTYTDPSGLTATTVSSAEDQVKLGQKLVEIPALMAITKLPSWTDPSGKNWRNYNTLVPYDGALGIKTGSTTKAGGNLLFAAHKMVGDTDQLIVGAVLGQHKPSIIDTVNAVSKEAMLATQDLLENAKVVKKGDVVGTVSDGLGGSTSVIATKDVSAVGWPGLTVKIELTDDGKAIPHSASAGTRVGTLTVGEGTSQVKVPVALQSDLVEPTFGQKLTRIG
ncbi:D-alanyl-D-alanine carboxypeptidase [Streptomyces sp. NPDC014622]|uniref:D-alanyl-D-alanine carboxypeptidase n=1 Tax=Streptomyces sp. NPDC014622 TaxID=3364874 RepID=UPI0036FB4AC8